MAKRVLVTGAAGFIGSHVAQALAARGDDVTGLDSFDPYYTPKAKRRNIEELENEAGPGARFRLIEGDVRDAVLVSRLFSEHRFTAVVHLAALANVRYSIGRAGRYFDVNVGGTVTLLDAAVANMTENFVFASTSSVYGNTTRIPFAEDDPCDRPLAPYPASKRAVELLAYSYHTLHGLNFTALRFFTVYGPRNRPDMMAHLLFDSILRGAHVDLYEGGQIKRDWTYVGDIAQGVVTAVDVPLGYEILNLGRGEPLLLADFVRTAESLANRAALCREAPLPPADMRETFANTQKAQRLLGYAPRTSVHEGMSHLWKWYRTSNP